MAQSERRSNPRPGVDPAAVQARSAEQQPALAGDGAHAAVPGALAAGLHDSPRQRAQRQQIRAAFGSAPVQRLVYFSDDDGAQAQTAKPKHPYWESPLSGTAQSLHNTADGARAAAVGALNVGALEQLSEEPTEFSGGGAAANGHYEFWRNPGTGAVVGHPVHTQDVTNKLTRVSKIGKAPEKRTEFKPVVHDHAADYGVPKDPYALLANPGTPYVTVGGAMDHYLQKPTD